MPNFINFSKLRILGAYLTGLFFTLIGSISLIDSVTGGIILIIGSILLLPVISTKITSIFSFTKSYIYVLICFITMISGIIIISQSPTAKAKYEKSKIERAAKLQVLREDKNSKNIDIFKQKELTDQQEKEKNDKVVADKKAIDERQNKESNEAKIDADNKIKVQIQAEQQSLESEQAKIEVDRQKKEKLLEDERLTKIKDSGYLSGLNLNDITKEFILSLNTKQMGPKEITDTSRSFTKKYTNQDLEFIGKIITAETPNSNYDLESSLLFGKTTKGVNFNISQSEIANKSNIEVGVEYRIQGRIVQSPIYPYHTCDKLENSVDDMCTSDEVKNSSGKIHIPLWNIKIISIRKL